MVRFEDALELEYVDGHNWKVTQDFYYDTDVPLLQEDICACCFCQDDARKVFIPTGFTTDFASIPRILWVLLSPTTGLLGGDYGKAAVVHDALYRTKGLATRLQADNVLYEAMTFLKVPFLARWTIYLGVRIGGYSSFKGGI